MEKTPKVTKVCKNGGYVEFEPKTRFKRARKAIRATFIIYVMVTAILGTILVYNFVITASYDNPDLLFSVGMVYSFVQGIIANFQSNSQISELSNNLTINCQDDECKAKSIFDYLNTFKYEEGTDTNNPEKILKEKSGDCDEMSFLYKLMLKVQGINSDLICTNNHCYSKVYLKSKTIYADLANNLWEGNA